ncbi:protein translocase subunit SecD [Peristeroidobacter agariperforans]|uniref:protein translocase subunit SecD n=1 Tax=Peristeroidobacter agariperforans TaxID=268404 RepID=UPI00101D8E50|nr:protein translocase subunit SecD [Peristeroidobacter agariperforans]
MYQFAKWKYWLIIIVMVVGTLFALPNVFGEGPALQLSRNDRAAMDQASKDKVLSLLDADSVPVEASYTEKDRLVLRFADAETQSKARETIAKRGNGEFLVALSTASRAPDWMRTIGLKPMSLGLDLRGGVHFVYEVDTIGAVDQAIDRMERDARATLRDKRVPYASVTRVNESVRVTLRSQDDLTAAQDALRSPDGSILLNTSDSAAGPVIEMTMTPAEVKRRQDVAVQQNITTLRNRVDELGISEPIVTRQAVNRIVVQLPGVQDPNEAIRVLGATATLEFRLVDETNNPYEAAQTKRVPIGSKLLNTRDGRPILVKRDIIATGEQLSDASSGFAEGSPQVNVVLDSRGGQSMMEATRDNVGKRMAVVYIEKKQLAEGERCEGTRNGALCTEEEVISDATIQSVLSDRFRITGLQATEARELALLLRSGALAAPQTIVEQRSVGPSLGQDNIDRGIRAMAIGLLLTFAFMAVYYRAFGWIANLVLLSNLVLTVGLLSMLQASLSLPGIAAVVFHMGIAVDANILIYERIREELRNGNSPLQSINVGFEKAFATIADSNVTTLIAGVVLFAFGTGTIRSFAIVMTLGIITSLFTSVVGSRALVHAIWGSRRKLDHLSI